MITNPRRARPVSASHCLFTIGLTLCLWNLALGVLAQQPSSAADDATAVEPFVSESTFLVVKVDPSRVKLPDLAGALEATAPDRKTSYRRLTQQVSEKLEQVRVLVGDQPLYATVGIPFSRKRAAVFAFVKKPSAEKRTQLIEYLDQQLGATSVTHGDYVVTTPSGGSDVTALLAAAPAMPRAEVATAFAAISGYPVQILLLPPSYVWSTVRDLSPELPSQIGGGPSSLLTEGIQWSALGIDPAQLRAHLVIQSATETAARDLAEQLPKMIQSAYDAVPEINKRVPVGLKMVLLSWLNPKVEGTQVTIDVEGLGETSANWKLLAALAQALEEKSRRHANQDRFKQILLAMHNYYEVNRSFPPMDKYRDKDGKHLLSWRVHILPYLDQGKLYDQFHLDEPWDSPHNKPLLEKMPEVYKSHTLDFVADVAVKPGYTTFQTPVGEGMAFGQDKAAKFQDFHDGTSNTVILVEVKPQKAVPWTAPEDYAVDPKDPGAGLLIGTDGRWLCAFADGSVQQLPGDAPVELLLHLFQISDGHPVDIRKIR